MSSTSSTIGATQSVSRLAIPLFASERMPGLDALRFAAVYLIVLSHLGFRDVAGFGVPILMALSGFLVTILLLREHARTGAIDVRRFYRRRFFRIGPQYLVFLAVAFAADRITGNTWPADLPLFAITYTVNYYNALNGHPDLLIAHVWTLAVLEQFYLIWPPLFAWLIRRVHPARYILAIICVVIIWRTTAYYVIFERSPSWVYNAFDCRLDSILVGALAAFVVFRVRVTEEFLDRARWPALCTALIIIALIKLSNDWKPWHYSVGYTVEAVLAMMVILGLVIAARFGILRLLENRVFTWLASISYGVFLYHSLAIGAAKKVSTQPLILLGISTALVLFAAYVANRFIEQPASRFR